MAVNPDLAVSYYNFRDAIAADLLIGLVGQSPESLLARARECAGVNAAVAGEWTERFWNDMRRGLARRR
jgi:hypothetical protein